MTAQARLRYPRKAQIERMIAAARASGLDVAGFEVSPDGSIRIMEARQMPKDDFERLKDLL